MKSAASAIFLLLSIFGTGNAHAATITLSADANYKASGPGEIEVRKVSKLIFGDDSKLLIDFNFQSFSPLSVGEFPAGDGGFYQRAIYPLDSVTIRAGISSGITIPTYALSISAGSSHSGFHVWSEYGYAGKTIDGTVSRFAPGDTNYHVYDFNFSFLSDKPGLPSSWLSAFKHLDKISTALEQRLEFSSLTKFLPDGTPVYHEPGSVIYFTNLTVVGQPVAPIPLPNAGLFLFFALLGLSVMRLPKALKHRTFDLEASHLRLRSL
ncbi:hypothetical protein [Roseovarius sp.]|uniref:hypothetical protein n=1 Tax=Roseovarius sp. TaxID=1486281 RepID=UPI003A969530